MNTVSLLADGPVPPDGPWVDDLLLAGPDDERCPALDQPITRETLRSLVTERQTHLHGAGLRAGGTVALCLPPSLAGITTMLAAGVFRGGLRDAFRERYPATLFGNMYGMTESG